MAKRKKSIEKLVASLSGPSAADEPDGYRATLDQLVAMLRSGVDYLGPSNTDGQFHFEVASMVALLEELRDELVVPLAKGPDENTESAESFRQERDFLASQLADAREEAAVSRKALQQLQQLDLTNQGTIVGLEERLSDSQSAFQEAMNSPAMLPEVDAATLVLRYPERDIVEIRLTGDLRIGRGDRMDVRVDGRTVSGLHAIIKWDGKVARVVDCNSTNGVYVNGTRVDEKPLSDGDELRVGMLFCIFKSPVPD
jgi:hypothetical protein